METCFNYCDPKVAFFSSDERKWITKIRKLAEQHPNEITILRQPETNDGCIYARLPASWLKVMPKVKREMSDEEKEILRERLARARQTSSEPT